MNKKQDLVDSVPLIILSIAMLYNLIIVNSTNIIITTKHYVGFILVGISIILFFFKRTFSEILTGLIVFAGLFGLVDFLPTVYSISIAGLKFQTFPLIVMIIIVTIIYNKYKDDTNSNLLT